MLTSHIIILQINRVVDAREIERLEAKLVNENTIEWRVKVNNNLGTDYIKTLLKDAANVLSQNGLTSDIYSISDWQLSS
jgi:hypothetical protein